jgi:hypothetical protein
MNSKASLLIIIILLLTGVMYAQNRSGKIESISIRLEPLKGINNNTVDIIINDLYYISSLSEQIDNAKAVPSGLYPDLTEGTYIIRINYKDYSVVFTLDEFDMLFSEDSQQLFYCRDITAVMRGIFLVEFLRSFGGQTQ